LEVSQRE
jgi:hypothetical protein